MAELFGVDVRTVSEHLRNIFETGELDQTTTIRNFRIVRTEGNELIADRANAVQPNMGLTTWKNAPHGK